jgi:hypothetical protein
MEKVSGGCVEVESIYEISAGKTIPALSSVCGIGRDI